MAFEFVSAQLAKQHDLLRYRQRNTVQLDSQASNRILIEGKSYLNFSSNDYLGLNGHQAINKAMQEGVDRFGASASASSLITGHHYAHQALENDICQWLNKPRCLLFSSGFAANLALLQTLGQGFQGKSAAEVEFYLDKLSHASMIEGAYHSEAKVKRFAHNNIAQLTTQLAKSSSENKLIASEGVFSMDGDQAKVIELAKLATNNNAWLYLDDAHSIGVIGDTGQGSNSLADIDITMATFGKALASSGAFIACSASLHEYLINFARHYIYSTAISPAVAWATRQSIAIAQQEQWRRDKIIELSNLFTDLLDEHIALVPSQSSIHAIIVKEEEKALSVSQQLKEQGIWLSAIRPPTVAANSSRLRVTICASHNHQDIKCLAKSLNKALN